MKILRIFLFSFLPLLLFSQLWFQLANPATEPSSEPIFNTIEFFDIPTSISKKSHPDFQSIASVNAFDDTIAIAQFSATPTNGDAPLLVVFTNLSENANTYNWDFGDGNISSDENPEHTFNEPGDFTITLIASNTNNSATETKIGYITVSQAAIEASFIAEPTEGVMPLDVTFTNNSLNAVDFSWDFGDGETSTEQSPMHTYTQSGDFTVSLIASNGNLTSTVTKANYITVDLPAPVANFSAEPIEGDAPLEVAFTDKSENATTWQWDFGDGSHSIEQNPTHTYNEGSYSVSLLVTNLSGNNSITKENLIAVNPNSINESLNNKIKLYPNPAKEILILEFATEVQNILNIEIIDTGGRMVKNITPVLKNAFMQEIDIQDLESGTYLLRLYIENETIVLSFNKE